MRLLKQREVKIESARTEERTTSGIAGRAEHVIASGTLWCIVPFQVLS
jgi:hypothetical protein